MPKLTQNTLTPLWELKKVMGIDNVTTDDLRVKSGFVRVCENVDIDDEFMAERRNGILQKVINGNAHSGWSDGKVLLMVLDDDLVQIETDWTVNELVVDVGYSPMNYVQAGSMVFFSNLKYVGYIERGFAYGFPEDFRTNRAKMPGGHLIEWHSSRFYVAQDTFIYRSIPGSTFEIDLEKDFIYVGPDITMLKGVNGLGGENGLYVSAGGRCAYLSNLEPSLETASYKTVLDYPALPGSAATIEQIDLKKGSGLEGKGVIWATTEGIFMGLPGGKVKDLTGDFYHVKGIVDGFSFIKQCGEYRQYVYLGHAEAGLGEATLEIVEPLSIISMSD